MAPYIRVVECSISSPSVGSLPESRHPGDLMIFYGELSTRWGLDELETTSHRHNFLFLAPTQAQLARIGRRTAPIAKQLNSGL